MTAPALVGDVTPMTDLPVVGSVATVVVLSVVAAALSFVAAVAHRAYSREPAPPFLRVLAGLGGIAVWLNTTGALGNFVAGDTGITDPTVAVVNLVSLLAGAVAAVYAGGLGDHVAVETSAVADISYEGDLRGLVRGAGRTVTVEIPDADRIDDIDGYDPVARETKEALSGESFVFPRGLTVGELRDGVTNRLKEDHGVGYVDLELGEDGSVEYVALGRRVAGIGPTLAPGSRAVALRADPAYRSSPGDAVQLWRTDPTGGGTDRVASGELRAAVDDTVTVILDEEDARAVDQTSRYRLVTLPSERGPEREFAAMLRSADETMATVGVEEGESLAGAPVVSVPVPVVAVRSSSGEVTVAPEGSRTLAPGDTVYVVGRPEELRRMAGPVSAGSPSG